MINNGFYAEEYYNWLADYYDHATIDAWSPPSEIAELITRINIFKPTVLDIGIGTGKSIDSLYQKQNFHLIEGIDVSQSMLYRCKAKYPELLLHQGDFLSFDQFTLKKYDLIICSGVLEFIDDINAFLNKCHKLLSEKGSLVLTYEPLIEQHKFQSMAISSVDDARAKNFMTYRYDPEEFHSLLTRNNFKCLSEKRFNAYKKMGVDIVYALLHLVKD